MYVGNDIVVKWSFHFEGFDVMPLSTNDHRLTAEVFVLVCQINFLS